MSLPLSRNNIPRLSAESLLSSTTRMRHPLRRFAAAPSLLGVSSGGRITSGRRTTNSLPLIGAIAASLNAAVVHIDQPPHQRQANAESALRLLQRPINLREHIEDAGQHVAGNADAVVSHADDGITPFPFGGEPDVTARALCTWRRCSAGSRTPERAGWDRRPGGAAVAAG